MEINLIAAVGNNNEIGRNNELPWKRIKEDFAYFKKVTEGAIVIMGRKTAESLPPGGLPGRTPIVLTRNISQRVIKKMKVGWANVVMDSLESAITWAQLNQGRKVFIIGGAEIYKKALELDVVNKLYMTLVHEDFPDADTFFPDFDLSRWKLESEESYFNKDYAVTNIVYSFKKENNDKAGRNRESSEGIPQKFDGFAVQRANGVRGQNYSY